MNSFEHAFVCLGMSVWRSVAAAFNNTFGSNITHVANAFSTSENEWIWIWFHTKPLPTSVICATLDARSDASEENRWRTMTNYQLIRVPYQKVHRQQRSSAWEYLTVISHEKQLIASNYEIEANASFMVTRDGGIIPQQYGGDLWIDRNGTNHDPQAVSIEEIRVRIFIRLVTSMAIKYRAGSLLIIFERVIYA